MELQEKFYTETGMMYSKEINTQQDSFNASYVEWLEAKIVISKPSDSDTQDIRETEG